MKKQDKTQIINVGPNQSVLCGPLISKIELPWLYTEQIKNDSLIYCYSKSTLNYGFARELSVEGFKAFLEGFLSHESKEYKKDSPICLYVISKDENKLKSLEQLVVKSCTQYKGVRLEYFDAAGSDSLYASPMHPISDGDNIRSLEKEGRLDINFLGETGE